VKRLPRILLSLCVLTVLVVLVVSAFGGSGTQSIRKGVPKGADFLAFYTGGAILAQGHSEHLYERGYYRVTQQGIADSDVKYYAVYPPPLYVAMTAVQPLSYQRAAQLHLVTQALLIALAAWLLTSAVPELGTWRWPAFWLLTASPIAIMNTLTGQGAGWWLCLAGAGVLLIRRERPLLGGAVLGLLCAKPSLGAAVAAFLLLTGQLRAVAGFGLGGAGLLAGSLLAYGATPWVGWLEWMRSPAPAGFWPIPERQMTWRTLLGWPLRGSGVTGLVMPTVLAGGGLAVGALARRSWRLPVADPRWPLQAGLILSVALLCLPHMLEYDAAMHGLAMLGVLLLLREHPSRVGAALLAGAWLAPLLFPVSKQLGFALGPFALTAAFGWAAWRSRHPQLRRS
jgi:hypothetical protein